MTDEEATRALVPELIERAKVVRDYQLSQQAKSYYGPTLLRPEHYPGMRRPQWRCLVCQCHVSPVRHVPGSSECDDARAERIRSQSE